MICVRFSELKISCRIPNAHNNVIIGKIPCNTLYTRSTNLDEGINEFRYAKLKYATPHKYMEYSFNPVLFRMAKTKTARLTSDAIEKNTV